jgi:hypothetical protein
MSNITNRKRAKETLLWAYCWRAILFRKEEDRQEEHFLSGCGERDMKSQVQKTGHSALNARATANKSIKHLQKTFFFSTFK